MSHEGRSGRIPIGWWVFLCLWITLALYPEAQGQTRRGPLYEKSWAVVIGIDHYQLWPPLQAAVADAMAISDQLKAVGFDHVSLLTNEMATRRNILTEIGTSLARMAGPNDRVLIYFAGHGFTEDLPGGEQVGYIIPVECPKTNFFAEAISMQQIRETFTRLRAKHIYYVMDCCFSGHGFTRSAGVSPQVKDYLSVVTERRAVQMITAGRKGDLAHEEGKHGIFTRFLLRGLAGEADLNGDKVITASELGAYVQPNVFAASFNKQLPQYGRLDGEGEIVFLAPRMAQPQKAQEPMDALVKELSRLQDLVKEQEDKRRENLQADLAARDRQIKELEERMKASLDEMAAMKAAMAKPKPEPAPAPPPAEPLKPELPQEKPAASRPLSPPQPSPQPQPGPAPQPKPEPQPQIAYAPTPSPAPQPEPSPQPSPSARFVDNADGTVTDRLTGLMWQKGGSKETLSFTWAQRYVDDLNKNKFAGYSDWRIPQIDELKSILLSSPVAGKMIDPVFGHEITRGWSSTRNPFGSYYAQANHGVDFVRGIQINITYESPERSRIQESQVRAVRGPVEPLKSKTPVVATEQTATPGPSGRFIDNGDGTVTDTKSGLMWEKNGSEETLSYIEAERYVNQINKTKLAGFSDWRIPAIEELKSLFSFMTVQKEDMQVDPVFGFKVIHAWSSSPSPYGMSGKPTCMSYRYLADLAHGVVKSVPDECSIASYMTTSYVRAVRGPYDSLKSDKGK